VETGKNRERDPKKTRQRIQMKDNAPHNNQPKEPKERKTKKKVTFHQENCLPKNAFKRTRSKRIPQVPPKEQEAKISPPPLRPIHSQ
jgi:hypothetical protein